MRIMHDLNDVYQQACHVCVLDLKINLGWLWSKNYGLWLSKV